MKQRLVFQIVQEKKFVWALRLSVCVEWILDFVQEMGVRTDLQGPTKELVPPNKFSSWVSWSMKHGPVCEIVQANKFDWALGLSACGEWILNFLQAMGVRTDLQLKELFPLNKFFSWVFWSVKHRLVFQIVQEKKFGLVLQLPAFLEWKLGRVKRNIFVVGSGFFRQLIYRKIMKFPLLLVQQEVK